mmetsp:Transcript_11636/g.16216  ORF Transcript_11636/g.16216 Transcript_11636/m.16216 type:complete len:265 (-) Transcript_11636:613-1407(-)
MLPPWNEIVSSGVSPSSRNALTSRTTERCSFRSRFDTRLELSACSRPRTPTASAHCSAMNGSSSGTSSTSSPAATARRRACSARQSSGSGSSSFGCRASYTRARTSAAAMRVSTPAPPPCSCSRHSGTTTGPPVSCMYSSPAVVASSPQASSAAGTDSSMRGSPWLVPCSRSTKSSSSSRVSWCTLLQMKQPTASARIAAVRASSSSPRVTRRSSRRRSARKTSCSSGPSTTQKAPAARQASTASAPPLPSEASSRSRISARAA